MVRRNRSRNRRRNRRSNERNNIIKRGGGFVATIKTALIPLLLLGANHKYKGKKTARKINKKRKRIKKITMKIRNKGRGRRRKRR